MLADVFNFVVSSAHAAPATTASADPSQGSLLSFLPMFVVFFLFMYFAVWRPQSKRAKEQQNLMSSIAKGDEIMTAGGILGRVAKMTDQYISLAIANNVEIVIQKTAVVTVLPKGTLKSIE